MDDAILKVMEAEAEQLEAKLSAIRSVISLYRSGKSHVANVAPSTVPTRDGVAMVGTLFARQTNVEIVRRVAIETVSTSPILPVPTREIMRELVRQGVHIAGKEPQNVVSSILSRTVELQSNGRSGWTLRSQEQRYGASASNENGASQGTAVDAPETATQAP